MRLQDLFSAAQPFQVQTDDGRIHTLRSAVELAKDVATAPLRYVLDDASVRMISECAFDQNSMLGSAVDLFRVPADRLWIEWSDEASVQYLIKHGHSLATEHQLAPRKVGVLIDSDETGRSGEVRMAWLGKSGELEVSPFVTEFDFDRPISLPQPQPKSTVRYVHIQGLQALDPFFACLRFRMEPCWDQYYRTYTSSNGALEKTINRAVAFVSGDFPFAAAFLLMLSTRTAFEERETGFAKLNNKRAKRGKSPLLDHIEIRMNLTPSERSGGYGGGAKSAPRLHHVSGHLVRRGETLFWRRSHLRGSPSQGALLSKTIAVTADPIARAA